MGGDEFGHRKGSNFFIAKDFGHFTIWYEIRLVLRILEFVPHQVSPKLLDDYGAACCSLPDNVSQFRGELHWFGETTVPWTTALDGATDIVLSYLFLNFVMVILMRLRMSFRHFF